MRKFAAIAGPIVLVLLSGCNVAHVSDNVTTVSTNVVVRNGSVHGGNQPVSGATVQLWQVGTTGYGLGATPLGSSVQSLSDGSFNITGKYDCTTAENGSATLVYITATGGNPGLSGTNSQLLMMTALGACGNLTPATFISINEVTTVVSVYALAQFMDASGNIGSYGYANRGLTNAFATVNNLVDTAAGTARAVTPAPASNGVVPQAEINTIANIMSVCINSVSGPENAASSDCSDLFTNTTPTGVGATGSSAPTNTLAAARNMALYPWFNAGASSPLYILSGTKPAFAPVLNVGPSDWTIALSYAGGGISARSIALDGGGFVWTANYASGPAGLGSVSKLNPQGVPVTNSPFTLSVAGPYAVAIDLNNDAWVVNHDSNQLLEFASNGNTLAGPFHFNETVNPVAVAVDGQNNIWVTNAGTGLGTGSVTEINGPTYGSSGQSISPDATGYTNGGINNPDAIAIDSSGQAWIADLAANAISVIGQNGTAVSPAGGFTGGGLASPVSVAIDSGGNAWVANSGANTLSKFNAGGALASYTVTDPGSVPASAVAVDGSGRVYLLKKGLIPFLAVFNSAGAQITATATENGYIGGSMGTPDAMAIDPSGNVWIANQGPLTVNGSLQTVTEFIGLATPSITPLALASAFGQVGKAPGSPLPVSVVTGALPYYTVSTNYFAQLRAQGGNTGTFTWSIASGTLPAGMSLSSSGLISGLSAATGSSTFTVTACDASNLTNCTTSSQLTLTSSNALPVGGSESMLNGSYVFRISGFANNVVPGNGKANGFTDLIRLTFNGAGTLTGNYDNNNSFNGSGGAIAVTGFYTVGADRRGTLTLKVGASTLEYAFVLANLNGSSIAQDVRIIEFDDTNTPSAFLADTSAGQGKLQTATAISFNQSFVFGVDGESPCVNVTGNGCTNGTFSPYGAVAAVGHFTGDNSGNIVSGQEDQGANSNSYNGITLTGSYVAADATGRGTFTLTPTGTTFPFAPTHYIYYVISPTEMYILSSDSHAHFTLLEGDVLAQTTAFTSGSTLSGNYVLYENAPTGGDGVGTYPTNSSATAIYIVANGSDLTGIQDRNSNGSLKLGGSIGDNTTTFDANGRMTLAPDGSGTPVFYFANGSQGFAIEQPNSSPDNQGDTGLLTIEQQTGGPFSCTPAAGTYALGVVHPPVPTGLTIGSLALDGTTTSIAATIDNSDPSGVLIQGEALSLTCIPDQNGITTSTTGRVGYSQQGGGSNVGYFISPTKEVVINAEQGQSTPSAFIVQK